MTVPRTPVGVTPIRGWRRAALMLGVASVGWVAATAGLPAHRAFAQAPAAAAPAPVAATEDLLSQAQLEQLLAPIALFPDQLLMQVLMAATYPLEVVQAKRWLGQGQNAQLGGEALATALQAQPWDPSVKSLVPFPDVLAMMNDQLEWTQQVGDALLGQQEDVLNTVQVLRGRAQAAGMLQSGPQQTVTVNTNVTVAPPVAGAPVPVVAAPAQIIVIEPAQPDRVYVPVYNPNVVFGTWPHTAYPPTYFPPPVGWGLGNALLTGMAFAGGVALVSSLWGWSSPGWGRGSVNINANRYNNINVNRTQISGNSWQHNPVHRQGVAYRNQEVNNRFRGGTAAAGGGAAAARDRAQSRDQFRGRMDQVDRGGGLTDRQPGGGDRPGLGDRQPGGGDRPGLGDRQPGGGDRPSLGDRRPGGGDRPNLADRGPAGGAQRPGGGERPNLADRAPPGGAQRPGGGERPNLADRAPPAGAQRPGGGERPSLADRAPAAAQRPAPAQRPSVPQAASGRPQVQQARPAPAQRAPQALQGVGSGGAERAAAQRGAASRQAPQRQHAAAPRGGGGGARAAGGGGPRGGGGGGGRRG